MNAEDIIAALLANPEARMAVLGHFWSPQDIEDTNKRAAELWRALGEPELKSRMVAAEKRATEAEARLTKALDGYRRLAEYFQESANCMTAHEAPTRRASRDMTRASLEEFRDQALSAPTETSPRVVETGRACSAYTLGASLQYRRCQS